MGRWTGSWLSGPAAAGLGDPTATGQRWRGQRLGLPAEGSGSVASLGRRLAAFAVDALVAAMASGLVHPFVASPTRGLRAVWSNGAFALEVFILVALTGQSIGMRLLGIRVVRLAGDPRPGLLWSAVRTLLLLPLIPALIWDRDNRGLHDRASGTIVLRI